MKNKYKIQENNYLEKINSMFILMNNISNINSESYIKYKMKRYAFVGETFNLSIEIVRKIFQNTFIRKQEIFWKRKHRFVINNQTYSYEQFLKIEKSKVIKKIKIYEEKQIMKYYDLNKKVHQICKNFKGFLSAKTIVGLLKEFGITISPKHLYFLLRNKRLSFMTLKIFPYLKLGKYHKKKHKETKHWITKKLHERPVEANERKVIGYFEVDTVEGKKGDKFNVSKQSSELKTLTSDNGTENTRLNEITENWYCTDAYSSWQKGSIEQKHKQFRKFFPKGISFKNLTQEKLDQIILIINCETYYQNSLRTN